MGLTTEQRKAVMTFQTTRDLSFVALRAKLTDVQPDEQPVWEKVWSLSFESLRDELRRGVLSPVLVLHAFQWKTLDAQEKCNCVTEFLDSADSLCDQLEQQYPNVDARPPLFGIPFSVKEQLELAGRTSTFGFSGRLGAPTGERDADVVAMLRRAGAVPFVRTNLPQAMVSYNCANPLFGRTDHPLDSARTPGGSSGGEAALLALGGAPFGIGTDGGGSVRIPCGFCGLTGFKPTSTRVSQRGVGFAQDSGVPVLGISWGPMCASVGAAAAVVEAAVDSPIARQLNPYAPFMPFRGGAYKSDRPMRVGVYDFDGWFRPLPAMRRAVDLAKSALEQQGHTLVDWQPPTIAKAAALFGAIFIPDGGESLLAMVKADEAEPLINTFYWQLWAPVWLKRVGAYLADWFLPRLGVLARSSAAGCGELRRAYADVEMYRRRVVDEWRRERLDAVICPAFGHPAPTHALPVQCSVPIMYTALYNLLDFPAGVLPATRVTAADEAACGDGSHVLACGRDADAWDRQVCADFCANTVGLPVGVQCVALPNEDEVALCLMRQLEAALTNRI